MKVYGYRIADWNTTHLRYLRIDKKYIPNLNVRNIQNRVQKEAHMEFFINRAPMIIYVLGSPHRFLIHSSHWQSTRYIKRILKAFLIILFCIMPYFVCRYLVHTRYVKYIPTKHVLSNALTSSTIAKTQRLQCTAIKFSIEEG